METIDMTNKDYIDYQSNIIRCVVCNKETRFLVKNKDIEAWFESTILPEKIESFSRLKDEDFALLVNGQHQLCCENKEKKDK